MKKYDRGLSIINTILESNGNQEDTAHDWSAKRNELQKKIKMHKDIDIYLQDYSTFLEIFFSHIYSDKKLLSYLLEDIKNNVQSIKFGAVLYYEVTKGGCTYSYYSLWIHCRSVATLGAILKLKELTDLTFFTCAGKVQFVPESKINEYHEKAARYERYYDKRA